MRVFLNSISLKIDVFINGLITMFKTETFRFCKFAWNQLELEIVLIGRSTHDHVKVKISLRKLLNKATILPQVLSYKSSKGKVSGASEFLWIFGVILTSS